MGRSRKKGGKKSAKRKSTEEAEKQETQSEASMVQNNPESCGVSFSDQTASNTCVDTVIKKTKLEAQCKTSQSNETSSIPLSPIYKVPSLTFLAEYSMKSSQLQCSVKDTNHTEKGNPSNVITPVTSPQKSEHQFMCGPKASVTELCENMLNNGAEDKQFYSNNQKMCDAGVNENKVEPLNDTSTDMEQSQQTTDDEVNLIPLGDEASRVEQMEETGAQCRTKLHELPKDPKSTENLAVKSSTKAKSAEEIAAETATATKLAGDIVNTNTEPTLAKEIVKPISETRLPSVDSQTSVEADDSSDISDILNTEERVLEDSDILAETDVKSQKEQEVIEDISIDRKPANEHAEKSSAYTNAEVKAAEDLIARLSEKIKARASGEASLMEGVTENEYISPRTSPIKVTTDGIPACKNVNAVEAVALLEKIVSDLNSMDTLIHRYKKEMELSKKRHAQILMGQSVHSSLSKP